MSCPIHDRCTCCNASLQYASITTTTGSSQFAPQSGNLLFGYEWAAPLVATSGGTWHTAVDPVTLHPPSTLYSGQDLSQPDYYRSRNSHETVPLYNPYQRESRAYPREQKQVLPSREQPQYTPYIQGVSRVAIPSSYSGSTLPALNLHRGDTSSFASHEELSQIMPVIGSDQSFFDEPPPPYTNNSLTVHPLGNAFQQPAVFSNDRFLSPMTSSPLAPVPLRHCSLYQVLKHESPASPLTGTLHSRVSSLAHALEPQDPQARQAPLPCASALGDRLGSYGISAPSPSATQTHTRSTSLNLVTSPADPCSNLVQVPSLALSAPAQMQSHVSSKTPPTARANAPSQNSSVITPSHSHTLAHPFQEATTHDYDTLPRLRKVSLSTTPLSHAVTHPLTIFLLSGAAPTCIARTRPGGSFCCV
ncbi:hypothetical protein EI94DRAFT_1259573 [Lactarius quietus]|nr:hypothetical protein EI94DRAFT_1259573 [Lactarius quietus]